MPEDTHRNGESALSDGERDDDASGDPDGRRDDAPSRLGELATSRRGVLYGAAVAGTAVGLGGLATGQEAGTIRLDGEVAAWTGRSPSPIAGETNPTLELRAGTEYEVTWINVDGAPHNFVVRNDAGEDLVRTEIMDEQGTTQSVSFTATEEMTTYLCEVHPTSMRGDVAVSGGGGTPTGTETETETGTPQEADFFQPGAEVGVQTIAEGMTAPTDMAVAAEDQERYFVADQTGEVWVVTPEGRQEEPFFDVSDRMVTLGEFAGTYAQQGQAYDERGLLGIEVHPDFAENRRFYLHYSAPRTAGMPENWDHVEVLSEFAASEDGSTVVPDSERRLLEIEHPQYNHDAGPLAFGPDGYLYFPMGDGGGRDDDLYGHVEDWYEVNSGGNGQDVTDNLLGSILRIDVDGALGGGTAGTPTEAATPTATPGGDGDGGTAPYGIPDDNPFVGDDDPGLDEIFAYGFRNPFGVSFDSEGNLFVADAGQELWEEANVVENGGNYGWNVLEGTHCFSTESPGDPEAIADCPTNEPEEAPYDGSPLIDPVIEFPHNFEGEPVGITIVGGHRYENDAVGDLADKYVFGAWTTDAARQAPDGRVLAATPPADFDGDGTGTATPNGGTETPTGTPSPATETATTEAGTPSETDVPGDGIWEMEELVFAGSEDGSLGYFVRMFGQDAAGDVYVLANQRGVPEGDTGVVMRLVPPEEGESLEGAATETPTAGGTPTQGEGTDTATEPES